MPWHRGLGWNPQRPDHRDFAFEPTVSHVPAEVELNFDSIPVLDQGQQGSCTGHGVANGVMFDQFTQGRPVVVPSREFIYYNARVTEGTQGQDSGAFIRDAVDVPIKLGAPPDSDFPYNDQVFNVRPPQKAYNDATKQKAIQYQATKYGSLQATIASGYPFIFGFTVYQNFYNIGSNGVMPMPQGPVVGGHCVIAFGYNAYSTKPSRTPLKHFKCRNSWSSQWGDHGNFYMPYAYFDKGLCGDYWVLKRLS